MIHKSVGVKILQSAKERNKWLSIVYPEDFEGDTALLVRIAKELNSDEEGIYWLAGRLLAEGRRDLIGELMDIELAQMREDIHKKRINREVYFD